MKRKMLPVLFMCLMSFCFILSGCGQQVLSVPLRDDMIYGNGGNVASKGDYVYYVNGYEGYADLEKGNQNNWGKPDVSSIYRAKVVNGAFTDIKQIVPKVGGFESTSLYVYGDTLFFTTPNTKKDNEGKIKYEYISLCKIGLNGQNFSEIYSTENWTNGKISLIERNESLFAIIFDGSALMRINLKNNEIVTLAKEVSSVVMPYDKTQLSVQYQNQGARVQDEFVYLTRARTKEENPDVQGNILEKISIFSKEATQLSMKPGEVINLKKEAGGRIYYSKDTKLFSRNFDEVADEKLHAYMEFSDFFPLGIDENGNERGMIVSQNSNLFFMPFSSLVPNEIPLVNSAATFLFSNEDCFYFQNDKNEILRCFINEKKIETVASDCGTINSAMKAKAETDGRFVFFFTKPDSAEKSIYLFKSDLNQIANGKSEATVAGKMLEKDIPKETDKDKNERP